ncbi:MAG: hypothetical protein CL610_26205 [Anaerolineaceae bacterium]|nr:hypothetical protein [Anaerolineaceae bacterium]
MLHQMIRPAAVRYAESVPGQKTGEYSVVPIRQVLGRDIIPRVVTGLIGVPIILFLTYVGAPLFNLGASLLGLLGGLELAHMIRPAQPLMTLLVTVAIVMIATAVWSNMLPIALVVLLVFVIVGLIDSIRQRRNFLRDYSYALGGALYVGLSMGLLSLIRADANGMLLIYMLLINNWFTDSFAMIGGRLWGKHKLAPTISPAKTIEGAAFGMTMGFIGGFTLGLAGGLPLRTALVANIFVAIATLAGDLIESLVKRHLHVKDSGSILPGHGGILDRVDGTLLAAPTLFLVLTLLG